MAIHLKKGETFKIPTPLHIKQGLAVKHVSTGNVIWKVLSKNADKSFGLPSFHKIEVLYNPDNMERFPVGSIHHGHSSGFIAVNLSEIEKNVELASILLSKEDPSGGA